MYVLWNMETVKSYFRDLASSYYVFQTCDPKTYKIVQSQYNGRLGSSGKP